MAKVGLGTVVFRVAVVGLMALNIYSIHRFVYSVVPWWLFWAIAGVMAAVFLLVFAVFSGSGSKWGKMKGKERLKGLARAYGMALLMYLVFFSFVPFWLNSETGGGSGELITVEARSSDAFVIHEDTGNPDVWKWIEVGSDNEFVYKGESFSKFTVYEGRRISFFSRTGCFGWEYIYDMR